MGKLFDVSLVFTSIPELLGKLPITLELAVLSMLLGLNGVWLSFLASEMITFIVILILSRKKQTKFKNF